MTSRLIPTRVHHSSDGFFIIGNCWHGASLTHTAPRAARVARLSCRNYPQRLFTAATRWQTVTTRLPKTSRSVPSGRPCLTSLTRLTRLTGSVHRTASSVVIAKWRRTDAALLGRNDHENRAWIGTPWIGLGHLGNHLKSHTTGNYCSVFGIQMFLPAGCFHSRAFRLATNYT